MRRLCSTWLQLNVKDVLRAEGLGFLKEAPNAITTEKYQAEYGSLFRIVWFMILSLKRMPTFWNVAHQDETPYFWQFWTAQQEELQVPQALRMSEGL